MACNLGPAEPPSSGRDLFTPTTPSIEAIETPLSATHSPTTVMTVVPPTPTPVDLSRYKQAMRPEFASDVDRVIEQGATRYDLKVTLADDSFDEPTGLRLTGQADIHYTNTETNPLSDIYFRLYPNLIGYGGQMTVTQIMVAGQLIPPTLEADNSALRLPLSAPLQPGESLNLWLTYQTVVPTNPQFGYNIFSYTEETVVLAGFYPAIAVYDEAGWHTVAPPPYGDATYLDIALFQVELTVPAEMIIAASGNLLTTVNHPEGNKTVSLVSGPMRDFYIAMRTNYQISTEVVDGIVVNSYYPPHLATGGQAALQYAVDSLRLFNRLFGPYPYAEFDVVATPTRAGGIEYPGIVVAAQTLYDSNDDYLQHVVGHEVAHQWWYGLVGNDQIAEPWLDEALTQYSTWLYWREVAGPEIAQQMLKNFFQGPYDRVKDTARDRAIAGSVTSFQENDYVVIVYSKGPLFFQALHQEVGDEIFYKILQTYYTEHKYGIAQEEDLIGLIERVYGQSIAPLYETWILGR